jgi:carbamoyltransferase
MYTLGINYLSESSVCLFKNNQLIYALSEERINRKKNWFGIPYKSITKLLKDNKLKLRDIKYFASHGLSALTMDTPNNKAFEKKILLVKNSNLNINRKNKITSLLKKRQMHEKKVIFVRTKKIISELKKKFKNIEIFDHHTSHAASAYYFSKFKNCYLLTIDGWGDNASSKLFEARNGIIKELKRTETIDSLGYFYGSITKLLGFTPHKHEGKVLGLAAHAKPEIAMKDLDKVFGYNTQSKNFEGLSQKGYYLPTFDNILLKSLLNKYSAAEIAAATQKKLEEVVTKYINDIDKKKFDLALAGGVFSNVKLNQIIQSNKKVNRTYVFPNMGDGGLCVGAAALLLNKKERYKKFKVKNMYLGPDIKSYDANKNLNKFSLKEIKTANNFGFIAKSLDDGCVVGIVQGKMEFGPRSLCNRSIISSAKDKKINLTLNKKLKRTEFMPFAPVVLQQDFNKYFHKIEKSHSSSLYMTMTFKCKNEIIKKAPGVVHIDNTARPQIVNSLLNKRMYKILKQFKKINGSGILINTSFNMHEEPIVCSVSDAFRAFNSSKLDYLMVNDQIFKRNK